MVANNSNNGYKVNMRIYGNVVDSEQAREGQSHERDDPTLSRFLKQFARLWSRSCSIIICSVLRQTGYWSDLYKRVLSPLQFSLRPQTGKIAKLEGKTNIDNRIWFATTVTHESCTARGCKWSNP
jgi:hypothetical protein